METRNSPNLPGTVKHCRGSLRIGQNPEGHHLPEEKTSKGRASKTRRCLRTIKGPV